MKKITINDPSSVFTTYDLGCSAALLCADFELLAVKKGSAKRALFVFRREADIENTANKYFADRLEVKARSFFDHMKALKNKLYS